jgi:hypothetical protein
MGAGNETNACVMQSALPWWENLPRHTGQCGYTAVTTSAPFFLFVLSTFYLSCRAAFCTSPQPLEQQQQQQQQQQQPQLRK